MNAELAGVGAFFFRDFPLSFFGLLDFPAGGFGVFAAGVSADTLIFCDGVVFSLGSGVGSGVGSGLTDFLL